MTSTKVLLFLLLVLIGSILFVLLNAQPKEVTEKQLQQTIQWAKDNWKWSE